MKKRRIDDYFQPNQNSSVSLPASPVCRNVAKAQDLRKEPNQPEVVNCPVVDSRRFLPKWFKDYSWLEWDSENVAAFCHPCRQIDLQGIKTNGFSEDAFVKRGFVNWKKALERFAKHEKSSSHIAAVYKFTSINKGSNIICELDRASELQRKVATRCLEHIFNSLRYLARQGLAVRGHHDNESNFKQLLLMQSKNNKELRDWLMLKTTWTSVEIQEEILYLMSTSIQRSVANIIQERKFYGLMADETVDSSQQEQLSICFRTVNNQLEAEEHFMGFYELDSSTGASIFAAIEDVHLRLQIDMKNCRSQTYDGASAFASQSIGVSKRILDISPTAIYTHCYMHSTNLAVQDSVANVSFMRDFLDLLQDMTNFIRGSAKRCATLKKIAEELKCSQKHIRPLCPTRFTVKYKAINGFLNQLPALVNALENIENGSAVNTIKAKASGYLHCLQRFDVYFALLTSEKIFEISDRLSTQLQATKVSAGQGVQLVSHAIKELQSLRNDSVFINLWEKSISLSVKMGADPPRHPRKINLPQRYRDSNCSEQVTNVDISSTYSQKYFEALDAVIINLEKRIKSKEIPVLCSIERLLKAGWAGLEINKDDVKIVCQHFDGEFDQVRLKAQLLGMENLRNPGDEKNLEIIEIIQRVGTSEVKKMIPQVVRLIQLYVVCPATSALPERSFSTLRRIKNCLRSTMSQKRLNCMMYLATYSEEVDNLNISEIVNCFILKNELRRKTFALL